MVRKPLPSDPTREQFETVRHTLETSRKKTRPRKHDLYDVFCGVIFFLQQGAQWRSIPPELPPWRTVHEYFTQWSMHRVGDASLLEVALQKLGREKELAQLRQMTTVKPNAQNQSGI